MKDKTTLITPQPEASARIRKDLLIDVSNWQPTIPLVGIFDEPTRCYKINKEWAKIVIGFLLPLTDTRLWKDATDDNYIAIQAIIEFLTGEACMDCNGVEDCLQISPTILALAAAIANNASDIVNVNNTINNNSVSIDISTTTTYDVFPPTEQANPVGGSPPAPPPGEMCNNDAIWAACWQLVSFIDSQNRDFLQIVAQGASVAKQASLLVSAVPVVSFAPFDEALDFANFLATSLLTEYNAIVTTALLQTVACDLFCIAINNNPCGLTFGDLMNYYSDKVPVSLGQAVDTVLDMIGFALLGGFQGDDYYYYMCYFQLAIAYLGQEFLGFRGVTQFGLVSKAGYNSPDSDWMLYCDVCPQDTWCYEWTVDNGLLETEWYPLNVGTGDRALWVAGSGWRRAASASLDNWIHICNAFGQSVQFDHVSIYCTVAPTYREYVAIPDTLPQDDIVIHTPGHTIETWDNLAWTSTGIRLGLDWNGSAPTNAYIYKVILTGTGQNPFGADNCTP